MPVCICAWVYIHTRISMLICIYRHALYNYIFYTDTFIYSHLICYLCHLWEIIFSKWLFFLYILSISMATEGIALILYNNFSLLNFFIFSNFFVQSPCLNFQNSDIYCSFITSIILLFLLLYFKIYFIIFIFFEDIWSAFMCVGSSAPYSFLASKKLCMGFKPITFCSSVLSEFSFLNF